VLQKEANIKVKNKMPNTEKPTTIVQQKKSGIVDTPKKKEKINMPVQKEKKIVSPKVEEDAEVENAKKPEEKQKPIQKKSKVKRDYAVVNAKSVPISTKHSMAICRFIKGKTIEKAIKDLEPVLIKKVAVPMKGEIPHRKGKMMSGRYPQKAVGHFITLLKSLEANAAVNELDEPVIVEAIANLAPRPFGRFGKTKKKRTHVRLKCVEKKEDKKKKNRGNKR